MKWFDYFSAIATVIVVYLIKNLVSFLTNQIKLNRSYNYVKGPKPHWLRGNADIVRPDEEGYKLRLKLLKSFPNSILIHIGPLIRSISLYSPATLQTALAFDQPKNDFLTKFFKSWVGKGLLFSHGKKWKRNRKLLTPAFHFDILKNYVQVFNHSVDTMLEKFPNSESKLDLFEPVSLMTLDSMLQCMMSLKTDCQKQSHPYVKAVYDISDLIIRRYYAMPWSISDFLYSLTSDGRKFKAAVDVTNKQASMVIKNRRKELQANKSSLEKKAKLDFLDIILLAKDKDGNELTETEINQEVTTFMFAGHDTTASAISWILYDLATNPEHQQKCREELQEILGGRDYIEYADLSRFTYLTMCIKESMRLHPPAPIIGRYLVSPMKFESGFGDAQKVYCNEKVQNGDHELPEGSRFEINFYVLHRNPFIWETPEKFDPLRFTAENIAKRPAFSYLPFSAGPRNCIGQNFAMMEIKIALSKCLQKFVFSVDDSCEKPFMIARIVLRSKTGINVIIKPV